MTNRMIIATGAAIAVLCVGGAGALRLAQNETDRSVERISDCYARVTETHTGLTTADLADTQRAYGRCH